MDANSFIHLLQISIVLVFFTNKLLILIGKKFGWLLGIFAASLAIFYFHFSNLIPYMILNIGIVVLMIYGFLNPKENFVIKVLVRLILVGVPAALLFFVFNGLLLVPQLLACLGIFFGTYFLIFPQTWIGWLILGIANFLAAYLGYIKGHIFFADFQLATAILAFIGVVTKAKQT
jgi:hypothetical protein